MAAITGAGDWRYGVLHALGAPDTAVNLDALTWWAESEGTPSWWNNWLATTLNGYGGRDVNSAGVKAYPTLDDGVAATVATLHGSAYSRVVAAFRNGQSLTEIFNTVNASPWCYGCQAGRYPIVLSDHLRSALPAPPPPPHQAPSHQAAPAQQYRAGQAYDDLRTAMSRYTSDTIGAWHHLQAYIREARR